MFRDETIAFPALSNAFVLFFPGTSKPVKVMRARCGPNGLFSRRWSHERVGEFRLPSTAKHPGSTQSELLIGYFSQGTSKPQTS